jgi:hypothetical protein
VAEVYDYGRIIREYGYYPQSLPIYICHCHGPGGTFEELSYWNMYNKDCLFLAQRKREIPYYLKAGFPRCQVMLNPFVFYRKSRNIQQTRDARGTLAFAAHNTRGIHDLSDISQYIDALKSLPEKYQPISVCVFWWDILNNKHKIYMESGLPVFTAGNGLSGCFVDNFYEIIRHFKYTTANLVGSYTYYSVEIGIPFFVYGPEADYFNVDEPGIKAGKIRCTDTNEYRKIYNMFLEMVDEVSADQKKIVERNMGVYDGATRLQMAKILYWELFRHYFAGIKSLFRRKL